MANEIKKNIITEVVSAATESGFTAIATAAGYPMLSLAMPFVKGAVLGVNLDSFDYAFEVAEHATLEAIRQSEQSKVDVLGRYYGNQFYKASTNWQDMHQVISMIGMLTFRQIAMIRLISDGFKGIDDNLFISNPSACIEIHRLLDYGIWQTEGASFGINDSRTIQLKSIIPTIYSDRVREELMLDSLSEEDLARTIDSLHLTAEGTPLDVITKEDYDNNKGALEWQEF